MLCWRLRNGRVLAVCPGLELTSKRYLPHARSHQHSGLDGFMASCVHPRGSGSSHKPSRRLHGHVMADRYPQRSGYPNSRPFSSSSHSLIKVGKKQHQLESGLHRTVVVEDICYALGSQGAGTYGASW